MSYLYYPKHAIITPLDYKQVLNTNYTLKAEFPEKTLWKHFFDFQNVGKKYQTLGYNGARTI